MSVVGEVVGVIACVAGIISAYHDGSAVIQKIKAKRAQKKAPPPPRLLEDSIDQAPQEIEREKQRGVARFGRAFEEGDNVAVIALQQITIQLQASLLEKLRHAAFDDEHKVTDFTYLVDAADYGRDRTIATMLEFRQRLLEAKPIVELRPPPMPRTAAPRNLLQSISESSTSLQYNQPRQPAQLPPVTGHRTWTRELAASPVSPVDDEKDATAGGDDPAASPQRKRSSFFRILKPHRSNTQTEPKSPPSLSPTIENCSRQPSTASASSPFPTPQRNDTAGPAFGGNAQTQSQPQQQQAAQSAKPKFTYQPWEDDPEVIWGSNPSSERRETVSIAPDALQPIAVQRTNSNSSSTPTVPTVPSLMPENDYLGLCKGAWKLHNGDRKNAFSKQREVDPWSRHPSGNANSFLVCSHNKCVFRTHVNVDTIWDKSYDVRSKGLKFRWAFLAKSHITQRVVVKQNYTFQCLFCTFFGEKGRLYHGIDHYLEHISTEHRGQRMSELVLHKTNCVNDRIATEDDDFDINLWPLSNEELQERQERHERTENSTVVDDLADAFLRRNTDAVDSVVGEEPWNEGLSDFNYHSPYE